MTHELSSSELTGQIGEIKWLVRLLQFETTDHLVPDHESKHKADLILLRGQDKLDKKKKESLSLGPLSTDPEFVSYSVALESHNALGEEWKMEFKYLYSAPFNVCIPERRLTCISNTEFRITIIHTF